MEFAREHPKAMTDDFPKPLEFVTCHPKGCDKCKTPLDDCRCIEDPSMDGIHYFREEWLCEQCLHAEGAKEFLEQFSKQGAMKF